MLQERSPKEGEETGGIGLFVGKKVRWKDMYYLVKWKEFDSMFNNWKSGQHLANEGHQENIDNFEQSL